MPVVVRVLDGEAGEEAGDLVAGQRDLPGWVRGAEGFGGAAMVRTAAASMARVTHRYQEVQRRTWCSSRPVRPFPAWKFSSIV